MMQKDSLKAGDWVTQYAAGFWRVERILPKYAEDDYQGETTAWKRGDLIGQWALLRKGFTNKMKFRLDFDVADASWCKPVTLEQLEAINTWFAGHPKDEEKFRTTPWKDRPAVIPVNLRRLTDEEAQRITAAISQLPTRFTREQFDAFVAEHGLRELIAEVPQPGGSILYLWANLYEVDCHGTMWLFGPELKRFGG